MNDYGYIYFAGTRDADGAIAAVKIGFSNDPVRRMAELATASPQGIELLAWLPGTRADERALHERFDDERASGEWFEFSGRIYDVVVHIGALSNNLPSWRDMAPFPRDAKKAIGPDAFKDEFGQTNFDLATSLVRAFGSKGSDHELATLLAQLNAANDWLAPSSSAMEYGLRAAIAQGIARPSYVLACVRKGLEQQQVPA